MNQKMVFLKTLLIIYPKNDKQSMVMKVCSRPTKQIFLKISQNSQENTSAGVSSNKKFAGLQPATLLNKRLQERCFPVNFAKLNNTFLTKRLRPTRPMPKFQPTPPTPFFLIHAKILWAHATYAKISTHATYQVNFFWTHATYATRAIQQIRHRYLQLYRCLYIIWNNCISQQLKIKATLIKRTSSERIIISKYFQRCDGYCLFTPINLKNVSELGKDWPFLTSNKLGVLTFLRIILGNLLLLKVTPFA